MKLPGFSALVLFFVLASSSFAQQYEGPWFSEESGSSTCPNGFALKGVRCSGKYCDNKQLLCESYTRGYDSEARYRWSRWFSEEHPNEETSGKEVVSGIGCAGRYCDNVQLRFLASPRMMNAGNCAWTPKFSEEQREMNCPPGQFITGVRCDYKYCDNLFLYCCNMQTR